MSENLNWSLGLPWWPGGPHIGGIRRRLNHFRLSHFPKTKKLEGGKTKATTEERTSREIRGIILDIPKRGSENIPRVEQDDKGEKLV